MLEKPVFYFFTTINMSFEGKRALITGAASGNIY